MTTPITPSERVMHHYEIKRAICRQKVFATATPDKPCPWCGELSLVARVEAMPLMLVLVCPSCACRKEIQVDGKREYRPGELAHMNGPTAKTAKEMFCRCGKLFVSVRNSRSCPACLEKAKADKNQDSRVLWDLKYAVVMRLLKEHKITMNRLIKKAKMGVRCYHWTPENCTVRYPTLMRMCELLGVEKEEIARRAKS